tara:strand:+ start:340 stop:840 length:501 start_codon:yes stop_codon:yes gene_type:complete
VTIKVIDNFLKKEEFNILKESILPEPSKNYFPWYYQQDKVFPGDSGKQFTHVFYTNFKINSEHFDIILPVLNKLNIYALRKVKINLTLPEKEFGKYGFHRDFEDEHKVAKTGIFYFNNTNGPTVFENGESIDCIENRMVIFPSHYKHAGSFHTSDGERVVLNINWY